MTQYAVLTLFVIVLGILWIARWYYSAPPEHDTHYQELRVISDILIAGFMISMLIMEGLGWMEPQVAVLMFFIGLGAAAGFAWHHSLVRPPIASRDG